MRISLITPVLNGHKYIENTLRSVAMQGYSDLEYIIIDGGSTDGTLEIIEKYKNIVSKLIIEKDEGLYYAMNKGIALATGDIVGIINADDWLETGALNKVSSYFNSGNRKSIFHGAIRYWNLDGSVDKVLLYSHAKLRDRMIGHPSMFIPKILYLEHGFFNTTYRYAADYELSLRFFLKGVDFHFSESVIANFRYGGLSSKNAGIFEFLKIQRNYNVITLKEYFFRNLFYSMRSLDIFRIFFIK